MIISRTPVRLSLFGGGTDYQEYFERSPGAVLGTTINKYIYLGLNRLSEFFDYRIRIAYSKVELVNDIDDILHDNIRECLRHVKSNGFLDVHLFSDLPARTGLGSSSAFTVGFLNALHALHGEAVNKARLAREAVYVERKMIGENVGYQDQYHAAYGGFNIIEFASDRVSVRPVSIEEEKKHALERAMMLFYTGLQRSAHEVVREQIDNTRNKQNDGVLADMLEMVYEAERVIARSSSEEMIEILGGMLDESWKAKKRLSNRITTTDIDEYYDKAISAGAYGGKLAGAGGGGFLLFIVPEREKVRVREALRDLLEVDFRFDNEGSKVIYAIQD